MGADPRGDTGIMNSAIDCKPAVAAIRVETTREVPDPLAWVKGFVCGFTAAALVAAGVAAVLWRF